MRVGLGAAVGLGNTLASLRLAHVVFVDAAAETGVIAAADEHVAGEVAVGRGIARATNGRTVGAGRDAHYPRPVRHG